jgi:hypothetical protein
MDSATLRKANDLQEQINELDRFIYSCESNRNIRFYKKKCLMATVSDYMRETKLYELNPKLRDKFIIVLKEEKSELQKQFDDLN